MEDKTCIVGIGDAGGSVLNRVAEVLKGNATLVAVNTDSRALEASRAGTRLQVGASHTGGLGAGGDVEIARQIALEDIEPLRGVFSNMKLAILLAGLGGGTGTGLLPTAVGVAREAGALTVCFVTLPFAFEGPTPMAAAEKALAELSSLADVVVVIPNDRLCQSVSASRVRDVFIRADEVLCWGVCTLWKMVSMPGYVRIGLPELRRLAERTGGTCTFGFGNGNGVERAKEAVEALLDGALFEQGKVLSRATALVVCVLGGPDLTIPDVETVMAVIRKAAKPGCHLDMGTVVDDEWGGRLMVSVLASEQSSESASAGRARSSDASEVPAGGRDAAQGVGRKKRAKPDHPSLRFEDPGKGRFKDAEPTILDGEDMDIPTFIRRGIPIER